ncbi:hypothetical protein KTO58_19780 [Chitinophaga pendula]|uniref:hypothetical protein n=1 Tax=Chitinophaga TaxID=79328 RepID=UPI000BAF9ED0|nr:MULTISPECIES: hypothetical protein [Chitinophaga]ASZ11092.1 hypothetical protein CK934_09020 [Chitinophaga sp. MD30]UCJ05911.1 hypothetical protein KTO58_19780 [Chitinophaga pendula]
MNEFIYSTISAVIAAFTAWVLAYKKNRTEVERSEIDNLEKVSEVWQRNADGMKLLISDLLNATAELRKENLSLKETVYKLEMEVSQLKAQNTKLYNKLNEIKSYADTNGNSTAVHIDNDNTVRKQSEDSAAVS